LQNNNKVLSIIAVNTSFTMGYHMFPSEIVITSNDNA
jgi:hypothetical protein